MTDRPPPHSPEAEQALLGSILLSYQAVLEQCIEAGISVDSFYVPCHRLAYTAMLALYEQDKVVNALSVLDSLRLRGEDVAVGGLAGLNRWVDGVLSVEYAKGHIETVLTKHKLRRVMAVCQQAAMEALVAESADKVLAKAEDALSLIELNQPDETAESVWQGILARIEAAERGETQEIGLPTGIASFDRVLDGLRKGGVYFITGEKGCGKTTIVGQIANNNILADKKVLFFTLEMTAEQLMERLAGGIMGASVRGILKGKEAVRDEAKQIVTAAIASGNLVIDAHTDNLDEFAAKVRKFANKGGDLVILDYIQRLDTGKGGGLTEETTAISKKVTRTAKKYKLPILCVSMESGGGLYGSRQLDYDAYGTLKVSRDGDEPEPPDYDQTVKVWLDKNRFGPSHFSLWLRLSGRKGQVTCVDEWEKEAGYEQFGGCIPSS